MRSRWTLAAGAVVTAGLAVWLWPRSGPAAAKQPAEAPELAARTAPPPRPRSARAAAEEPPVEERRQPSPLESMPSRIPESYTKPGQVLRFAKQVEAKPDPELEAAERLEYKRSRLRFRLADAAAECYDGEDGKAAAQFTYTLVVQNHRLRVENVKLGESTLHDPQLEDCMISQIESIDGPADSIPDQREDGSSWISLHDLSVRTRAAADRP